MFDEYNKEMFRLFDLNTRALSKMGKIPTLFGKGEESVLYLLYGKKSSLPVKTIKEILGISAANLSRILKSLENYKDKGCLIKRKQDSKDIRCKVIQITTKGNDVFVENYQNKEKRFILMREKLEEERLKYLFAE